MNIRGELMMRMERSKTSDGNDKILAFISEDIMLTCYRTAVGDSFAVHGKGKHAHLCTLKEEQLESTFKECERIHKYGGDFVKYLQSFKVRNARPSYVSDDGEVRCYYHQDKEKKGFIPKCIDHGVKGHLHKTVYTEEEADRIAREAIKEYNETGRYKRELDKAHRSELPCAYVSIDGNASLDDPKIYSSREHVSLLNCIKAYCNSDGLLDCNKLIIYVRDGGHVEVKKDSGIEFNVNNTLLLICNKNKTNVKEYIIPLKNITRLTVTH